MKVLAKVRAFSGGAPLSLLEYLKIIKNLDNEVLVAAEFTSNGIEERYKSEDFKLHNITALNHVNIISKIIYLFKGYNILKKHDIDFLIVITTVDIFFYSYIADLLNIPILIIIAGGKISERNHKLSTWANKPLICFSKENYNDLKKLKYNLDRVYQISNRINTHNINSFDIYSSFKKNSKIRLLIISRIDTSKIKSIRYVIRLISYLVKKGYNVELNIAGSGPLMGLVEKEIEDININAGCMIIKKLGFVKDLSNEILGSHIVFGKGRSVIEAIMMNRVGIVVNEDNEMIICTTESRDNLTQNNFAGRNLKIANTFSDIEFLLDQIKNRKSNYMELENLAQMVKRDYSVEYLEDKLRDVFKKEFQVTNKKYRKYSVYHKLMIIFRVVHFYILTIKDYFLRFLELDK